MQPPTAGKLPEAFYDAPRIAWYANAIDHPSIFRNDETVGFKRPVELTPQFQAEGSPKAQGFLVVEVVSVHDLPALSLSEHGSYRVTAFLPGGG